MRSSRLKRQACTTVIFVGLLCVVGLWTFTSSYPRGTTVRSYAHTADSSGHHTRHGASISDASSAQGAASSQQGLSYNDPNGAGWAAGGRSISLVPRTDTQRDILVMYIFSNADAEYQGNLRYFIEEAILKDTRSEFLILVSEEEFEDEKLMLPQLPSHARYIKHNTSCYDWGTYGWVMSSGHVDVKRYRYIFLVNCVVRGPFVPPYLRGSVEWWEPFVSRLVGDVKLVGSTISCEAAPLNSEDKSPWRSNPHVQSFALVMDADGLAAMQADPQVFACHDSLWSTVYYSELGSSAAVLQAGYNMDSLMVRYQGVDWRDEDNWGCNGKFSPNGEFGYDGLNLDPYEVAFVKVRSYLLQQSVTSAMKAKKYSFWQYDANVTQRVLANDYLLNANRHKVPKILERIAHGFDCFDAQFYLRKNPDLAIFGSEMNLWKHFVYFGQFEPRAYKFKCPMDYERFVSLHNQHTES